MVNKLVKASCLINSSFILNRMHYASQCSPFDCPPGPDPDADFGEAPLMLSVNRNKTKLDIVAAVQKSGFAWALDRNNGSLMWFTVSWLDLR